MKKTILAMALMAIPFLSALAQEPALQVDEKVDCGSSFTLTATPTDVNKFHFVKWSDDVTENPRTFTDITEALSLTAIFAHNDLVITFTVDATIGEVQDANQQVITELSIPYGETRKVKAVVKDNCYEFAGWYKVGEETPYSTNAELEIKGLENLSLEARFVIKKFEVKVSLQAGSEDMGTVSLSKID